MNNNFIDLNKVFSLGASYSKLPFNISILLDAMCSTLEWVPDPEGVYKQTPSLFRPSELDDLPLVNSGGDEDLNVTNHANNIVLNGLPDSVKFAFSQILLSAPMQVIKNTHDFDIKLVDMWDGAEGIQWHCDILEGGQFFCLVYLTKHGEWQDEFGGQFEFGQFTPEPEDGYIIHYNGRSENITSHGTISPENGTMVVVNNHNPFMIHRCSTLKNTDDKRITISIAFDTKPRSDVSKPTSVTWPDNDMVIEGTPTVIKA